MTQALADEISAEQLQKQNEVRILPKSFEQVTIQLHSLGLIIPAADPGIWTLSPFGREQLTKLKAIKRP